MKSLYLLLAIILVVPVAACKHGMHSGVKGSGKREVQKRDLASFKSISTEGAFTVEVQCQKDQDVEVEPTITSSRWSKLRSMAASSI